MQTVKLGIIFVKLAHNKTLDLGGDSYPTHFTPSLGNPISASYLQAGNFAAFQQTVTRFGAYPNAWLICSMFITSGYSLSITL